MSKTETAHRLAQQKADSMREKIEQLTAALDNLPEIIGQGISDQVQPVIEIRNQLNEIIAGYQETLIVRQQLEQQMDTNNRLIKIIETLVGSQAKVMDDLLEGDTTT